SLWAYNTSNQTEWEVHDFNPNGSDDSREIFAVGPRLYFEAKDDNNPLGQPLNTHLNKQLWTYETTNDTAWKLTNHTFVSQVLTHNNVAKYLFYGGFSLMGTRLYFTAQDSNGVQIWAHETTNESTWAVTNIGMYGVQEGQDPIIVMGSQLYFSADNGDNEGSSWGAPRVYNELWAYDTTNETAWRTSNHCTPGCHGFSSSDHSMTSIGTRIFFTGSNNVTPTELFAHETTNGSTWLVEDISPSNNNPTGRPLYYVSMGSTIYFEAEDNQSGREPWAYDVTNDTAWQVCDVNPNSSVNGGDGGFFQQFAMGERFFFQGDDGIHGSELWALDTINGAGWMVADINTYSAGISSNPSGFAAVGNQLYFAASKKISQNKWDAELWVHDPANLTFNGSGGSSGTSGGGGGGSNDSVIWSISPSLPTGVNIDQVDGTISGTPTQVMGETIYTVLATHSSGNSTTFEVSLMVLEDTDGDGDPDSLPVDYDTTGPTPGLVEDLDDDNDGYADVVETNTGTYSGTNDTGTDPLNPDTDGDGICDGPNDVPPICTAGPDRDPPTNVVGVIDIAIETVEPYLTFPNMTYTISPELPAGLVFDSSTGELSGTATSPWANTTYTVHGHLSDGTSYSWQFGIEILDDTDGDGLPNELPVDYPLDGELIEDTDDDNDGLNDTTESFLNTSTTNPDTDGDGFCDGPIAIINGTNGV
ncbi:MAG: putative Ig domain-containing protein, partial [Candidatus Thalassarchaeum sp.]|nr:putative Ig domain-containing protein [Candidatus Thalassarchaeum sp.]